MRIRLELAYTTTCCSEKDRFYHINVSFGTPHVASRRSTYRRVVQLIRIVQIISNCPRVEARKPRAEIVTCDHYAHSYLSVRRRRRGTYQRHRHLVYQQVANQKVLGTYPNRGVVATAPMISLARFTDVTKCVIRVACQPTTYKLQLVARCQLAVSNATHRHNVKTQSNTTVLQRPLCRNGTGCLPICTITATDQEGQNWRTT